MAIQPIDLQTLYTQMDKVSKTVAFQQQGMQLKSALLQDEDSRKTIEKNKAIKETAEKERNADKVSDERQNSSAGGQGGTASERKNEPEEEIEEKKDSAYIFKDPNLGKIIDITG